MKRKMSRLNEELIRKSNLDIPTGPVKVDGATNPVYTDALNQHAKREKEVADMLKDANKVADIDTPFTGSTDKKNMPKKVEEAKMVLDESLFEDFDLNDPNTDYYAVNRYLDVEIPDMCSNVLDVVENMTERQISRLADRCRNFYDYLESKLSSRMTEAYEYEGADQMGRAQCSPLVPDYSKTIIDYVKHYGEDPRYDTVIKKSLKGYVESLQDAKLEVENFNSYWNKRYPLLIQYIDDQIALIPFDVISVNEDLTIGEDIAKNGCRIGEIAYSKVRNPLSEVILDELTLGEVVFRYKGHKADGKENWMWMQLPSLGLDARETAIAYDENDNPYIRANVYSESDLAEVEKIAAKYGKEVTNVKINDNPRRPYWKVTIFLDPQDDIEPYFDPNVKIRGGRSSD